MENLSEVNNFNEDPVFYCSHCLSLKVRQVNGVEFCDKCSSTDIETSSIEDWEKKYMEKYGHKFVE